MIEKLNYVSLKVGVAYEPQSVKCMLNKNTLGIKKCEANQKQHCK